MSAQGSIKRYMLILDKARAGRYPSFADLKDYLHEHGFEISARTLQRDIEQIRIEFGVEIKYDRYRNGYFVDEESSVNKKQIHRFLRLLGIAAKADLFKSLQEGKEALKHELQQKIKHGDWAKVIDPKKLDEILELIILELHLDSQGGPTKAGELFEECLFKRADILESLGLPNIDAIADEVFSFKTLPTDRELDLTVLALQAAAAEYLAEPAKTDEEILRDAIQDQRDAFEVLPELGLTTHLYTLFIYDEILLKKKEKIDAVLEIFRACKDNAILGALGVLKLKKRRKAYQKTIQLLKSKGIKYIEEYLADTSRY